MTRTNEQNNGKVQSGACGTVAPLINVSLCLKALDRAIDRPAHLPGMVCFYGPAGWGKSKAASYAVNVRNAYYVQCSDSMSRKAFFLAILKCMGIAPERTLYEMSNQVCEQLVRSRCPLIVDEFDYLVKKEQVEIVRDIYEGSQAAILLIGEELMPNKLKRWERFHRRVIDWVAAQPADIEDCRHLASLYCRGVAIEDDLLAAITNESAGSTGRICINLERVMEEARELGLKRFTRADWGDRSFFTGEVPARRIG